jgi:putative sterol carrier protein
MVGRGRPDAPATVSSVRSAHVAEFLSDAWIAALDRAARSVPPLAGLAAQSRLVVEQRVRRDDAEIVYAVRFDGDGVRVEHGAAHAPDLVLHMDAVTARAIQQGTTTAQEAVASGRLKVRGRLERLRALGEALRSLDDVFRDVRAATTDGDGEPGDT